MARLRSLPFHFSRKAALASAAVVALAAAGAIGELSTAGATAVNEATASDQSGTSGALLRVADRAREAGGRFGQSEARRLCHLRSDRSVRRLRQPSARRSSGSSSSLAASGTFARARRAQVIGAEGSGFFVSSDGYIVTNNHVVKNAKTVTMVTDDGKTLDAKVVGTDPEDRSRAW